LLKLFKAILPPLLAFGLMLAAYAIAVRASGSAFFAIDTWFKWDGGHYFSIADTGYELIDCAGIPGFHPGQWCGNSAWFPGYPYFVRLVHVVTGYDTKLTALFVSQAFALLALGLIWNLFLSRRNLWLLLLCAFAPGTYYFLVVFPMSMVLSLILLTLWAQRERHYLIAFFTAAAAGFTYPTGVILAGVLACSIVIEYLRGSRPSLRAWLTVVGPIIAFGLVLIVHHVATGHWNAFFLTQEKYKNGINNPLTVMRERLAYLWVWHPVWWKVNVQSLMAATLVLLSAGSTVRAVWRRNTQPGDIMLAVQGLIYWLFPMVVGGHVSPYRAESLLVPSTTLLNRMSRAVVIPLLTVAIAIWLIMATEFARGNIV
jgi:hypothetical protein